jgi:hypothetical protein
MPFLLKKVRHRFLMALTSALIPGGGNVAVHATIQVPLEGKRAHALQFALHETFAVKHVSINGQSATFSFQPAELNPINPATKNVSVRLPFNGQQDKVRMDIEYEGHLKESFRSSAPFRTRDWRSMTRSTHASSNSRVIPRGTPNSS